MEAKVTDSLRDRIAAALWDFARPNGLGMNEMPEVFLDMADAVIAKLGLREEHRHLEDGSGGISTNIVTGVTTSYCKPATRQHRYVTEWGVKDE